MNLKIFNPYKVLIHFDTLLKIAKGQHTYPISCEIDPSNYCNHSCIWCINGRFRRQEKVSLEKNLLFDVINQLAEIGVKSITFTGGGEPLIHPDILTALCLAKEKGLEIAVVTNGGLLDSEKVDVITKTCKFIRFSIDAGEEETYKKLHRAKNNLKNIFDWINVVASKPSHITIGVAYLVHPKNYREISTCAYMAKEAGAHYIQIRPVFMRGLDLSHKIISEMAWQIEECFKLENDKFRVYPITHRFEEIQRIDKGFGECLGHNLLGVIAANGKMYVCCQLRGLSRYCLGDLYKQSFKAVWGGKQRQEAIKKINVNRCPPCRYTGYNSILEYLKGEKQHTNFL